LSAFRKSWIRKSIGGRAIKVDITLISIILKSISSSPNCHLNDFSLKNMLFGTYLQKQGKLAGVGCGTAISSLKVGFKRFLFSRYFQTTSLRQKFESVHDLKS